MNRNLQSPSPKRWKTLTQPAPGNKENLGILPLSLFQELNLLLLHTPVWINPFVTASALFTSLSHGYVLIKVILRQLLAEEQVT